MTDTEEVVDLSLFEQQFEETPEVCDIRECSSEASWRLFHPDCGYESRICDEHKLDLAEEFVLFPILGLELECPKCLAWGEPADMLKLEHL